MSEVIIILVFILGLINLFISYYYMNKAEKEKLELWSHKYELLATMYKNVSIYFGFLFIIVIIITIIMNNA